MAVADKGWMTKLLHGEVSRLTRSPYYIGLRVPNIARGGIGPNILDNGLLSPQLRNTGIPTGQDPPTAFRQNFNVAIPAIITPTLLSLNVVHFDIVGAQRRSKLP
ncbi:hypothetical protein C8R45DRAFT_939958 [Mycena sanguinolenta]|nr:hypothetical protein C8R45DRAFT_939958 [Mycena sanguinolenta]